MKKFLLFSFLLMILINSFQTSFANCSEEISISYSKIYLSADKILVHDASIEVEIKGEMVPVEGLFVDSAGVYTIIAEDCRVPPGTWMCPRCQRLNSSFRKDCQFCGWPK